MTTNDLIECPFCAELIKVKAKKCRYCGEFLEVGLTQGQVLAEFAQGKTAVAAQPPTPAEAPTPAVEPTAPVAAETAVTVTTENGETAVQATNALSKLYAKLEQMPDSDEKTKVMAALQQLEAESQKGDEADEGKVEDVIKNVVMVLPDVAEITINTIINPASGLATLIQKVAKRVAENRSKKAEETEPVQVAEPETAEKPAQVDATEVSETLSELQEQITDSATKEVLEQALGEIAADETTSTTSESSVGETVSEMVEGISKISEVLNEAEEGQAGEGSTNKLVEGIVNVVKNVVEKQAEMA